MRPPNVSELNFEGMIEREWLIANGLGGYASSTLCGLNTRKYHGLLVAAMSPPARRMVLLSHVDEIVTTERGPQPLSCNEYPGAISPHGFQLLRAFDVDPFPRWAYQGEGFTIEKSLRLFEGQNTACLSYSLLAGGKPAKLEIRPLLALRPIHELTYQWNIRLGGHDNGKKQVHIPATSKTPEIFFTHDGEFHAEPYWYLNSIYRCEQERGYAGLEDVWSPGIFRWTLMPGQTVYLICSTDPVDFDRAVEQARRIEQSSDELISSMSSPLGQDDEDLQALLHAASAFVVASVDDGVRTPRIMTQYPWSAPNGRSALIAFAGLLLVPGRFDEAARLLRSLAGQMRAGLIPTDYAENGGAPQYNGADTSLWFIHAVGEYLAYTGDQKTAAELLPAVDAIIDAYRKGTELGISCDADGLVASVSPGNTTSWMDARLGDWIVTPRPGRTVELNALWYTALRVAAQTHTSFGTSARATQLTNLAKTVQSAFNRRFWNPVTLCCFDVVGENGNDAAVRPNQILAGGLTYPVLATEYQATMLHTVLSQLLTPFGLRTLKTTDHCYQGRYGGGVVSRDRSQHQGSVYPWLLGPLATTYLRVNGRNAESIAQVRQWLQKCLAYLRGEGLGQLCELFDGDTPHRPGGAIASAPSVGEVLHCYARDVLGLRPPGRTDSSPLKMPPTNTAPITTPPTA